MSYIRKKLGRLARWRKWRACDVGEAKEGLGNELWRRWSDGKVGEWAELFLQPFHLFTYATAYSPTLLSLYLCHSSFCCFTYVTAHSPILSLYLHHSLFSPVSFPCWVSFQEFSSAVRQMTGKLRCHQSPDIIGHQTLLFRAIPVDFTFQAFILLLPSAADLCVTGQKLLLT